MPGSNATSPSQGTLATPTQDGNGSSPRSALTSPEPASEKEADKRNGNGEKTAEEVEALSDMMCSLVTNNCGETRYIGKSFLKRFGGLGPHTR